MNHEGFSENFDRLRASVREAPLEPGVYLMRDGDSRVIYVGKAKTLKNRLTSYFSGEKDVKTRTLLRHAHTIETIIVSNEYEALLLENTLIKQHSPKYNINLKDGKTYPVVRITKEAFPRVFRTRRVVEDGSLYYGPFPNVPAVDTMLHVIDQLFPLRKCRRLRKRSAPCMYFHIGRCSAPCCGKISQEDYAGHVERIKGILSGETGPLIMELTEKMHSAARDMKYELAGQFRDAIRAIEDLSASNSVVDFDPEGRDYLAWAIEGILTTFTVFSLRGGKMTGRELFSARSAAEEEESLVQFITTYYGPDRPPPSRIYLAGGDRVPAEVHRWFQEQFGQEPDFHSPDEKRHEAVLAMAYQNAREDVGRRLKERGAGPALDELAQVLGLSLRPERIEGFDIAQLDGSHPVASLVSFKDGVPDKKNYRHLKLRTVEGIVDDFAAMREAVSRRYSRLAAEGKELPDLILIDGGIGQVNAAKGVLDALGIRCGVVGLAKREEELWLPGAKDAVRLPERSEALKVLQFVRDETHRFATSFNQRLRSKDLRFPALESVEGVGPRRAATIMRVMGSLEKAAAATAEDLASLCRIPEPVAKAVRAAAKLALADRAAETARLRSGAGRKRHSVGWREAPGVASADVGARLAAEAAEAEPHGADGAQQAAETPEAAETPPSYPNGT